MLSEAIYDDVRMYREIVYETADNVNKDTDIANKSDVVQEKEKDKVANAKEVNAETGKTAEIATDDVVEETRDLMKDIMTLDEEDLKLIIGDKITQRKIEVYKE